MQRWVFAFMAVLAPLLAIAKEADSDYVAPALKGRLETVIPASVKHLQISNPVVIFHVVVDVDGSVSDYLAVEATHHELLAKAEERLQKARFTPARLNGEPVRGKLAVGVGFYDPEQRAWRSGMAQAPMGGSVSDGVKRRFYERAKDAEVYKESQPAELDQPLRLIKSQLCLVHPPGQPMEQGRVVVEYYVDRNGKIRLPKVLESDSEYLTKSALLTLEASLFEAPVRNGRPTFVKVRQPFNFS